MKEKGILEKAMEMEEKAKKEALQGKDQAEAKNVKLEANLQKEIAAEK